MRNKKIELMGHLMRRAGFGAGLKELEDRAIKGYDATVEELISTNSQENIDDYIIYRYHPDTQGGIGMGGAAAYWLYRMINTSGPLHEKMSLFWHSVFATGYQKVTQGKGLMNQIAMFRKHGMGSFRDLLIELCKDPSMIIWLDNQDNHASAINENFGRELLELFSMGVGNYTEQDVKECARAFTGWTVANTDYVTMKAQRDSLWPYGRTSLRFEYRAEDHDNSEKEFLGHRGTFNGDDIVNIICNHPATPRFIARHLYHFFVADEPPVPKWPYEAPANPKAIDEMVQAYFKHDYRIDEMLRVLFSSNFFKSESCWFKKVKSPTELVANVLKLAGQHDFPNPTLQENTGYLNFMGQTLINPPSVEGWHQGTEWIDTGTAVERINYATQHLGNESSVGIKEMVKNVIVTSGNDNATPENLVQACLDQLGAIRVNINTREALLSFAEAHIGQIPHMNNSVNDSKTIAELIKMVAATPDFQLE